jgi:hypothetical protein
VPIIGTAKHISILFVFNSHMFSPCTLKHLFILTCFSYVPMPVSFYTSIYFYFSPFSIYIYIHYSL